LGASWLSIHTCMQIYADSQICVCWSRVIYEYTQPSLTNLHMYVYSEMTYSHTYADSQGRRAEDKMDHCSCTHTRLHTHRSLYMWVFEHMYRIENNVRVWCACVCVYVCVCVCDRVCGWRQLKKKCVYIGMTIDAFTRAGVCSSKSAHVYIYIYIYVQYIFSNKPVYIHMYLDIFTIYLNMYMRTCIYVCVCSKPAYIFIYMHHV